MKERTKETIKDGFGSLVSNGAAVRGAKNGPLWLTLVMFFLSIIFAVLPLFIAQANTYGSTFLKSRSYGMERYVTSVALKLQNERHVEFGIDENHLLTVKENDVAVSFDDYGSTKFFESYDNAATGEYNFLLYISSATSKSEKSAVNTVIAANAYTNGTKEASTATEGVYHPNYMILFKNGVYVAIYGTNTSQVTGSYSGDFNSFKANDSYLAEFLKVTDKDGVVVAQDITNDAYVNGVYKNFKRFLDKSYSTLKIQNMWGTTGIYAGIFAGLNILMGFLMWIITRGKDNPNNYFSMWLTLKIQARMSLCPGLLTLIVGLFLTNYVPVIYILTIGLRVMWVSMKELRPVRA